MDKTMYPSARAELAHMRHELAPKPLEALSAAVFADGAYAHSTLTLDSMRHAHGED